jgi:hypothetical protein
MNKKTEAPGVPAVDQVAVAANGTLEQPKPGLAEIRAWFNLKLKLAEVKVAEAVLRAKIARGYFPKPEEGTNNFDLADIGDTAGGVLKLGHSIERNVDEAVLTQKDFQESWKKLKIPNVLIKWEPKLSITLYRTLTDEQRAVVDTALIIRDGSPQLDIKIPKRPRK